MFYYLLVTAFTVSIDSFICGFSLATNKCRKTLIVSGIVCVVFAMCVVANYLPVIFNVSKSYNASLIGGIILIAVGIFNLVKSDRKITFNGELKIILLSGFAVGLDGAVANLSLSLMGINAFYVPMIIAVMHGFTISLGVILSKIPFFSKGKCVSVLSPLLLILLGLYKCVSLLL